MSDLYEILENYCADDYVPMHMPGHKRNRNMFSMENPYGIDITEIDGMDNLHHATGILKTAMQRTASDYGAKRSWYLVNGSSVGLMAAILALTNRNEYILMARNCHISVYNAVYENELHPVYTYPEFVDNLGISGKISPENVEKLLTVNNVDKSNCGKIGAIVITSPTYEGRVSDIKAIAEIAHRNGIPLIVDEAHGAHFRYSDAFPESALDLGADVVVQSIHKTLPAFTQTALLHLGNAALEPDRYAARIEFYINILQSTSPSYLLMASIDRCLNWLKSGEGMTAMQLYIERLKKLRNNINQLSTIKLAPSDDISKIVLYTENGSLQGKQLYDILLKQYHIQLEMASQHYVIAMTSIGDTDEYYDRFWNALQEIDNTYSDSSNIGLNALSERHEFIQNDICMKPYDAMNLCIEEVSTDDCEGRVSASYVSIYPPGIPLVCPGEIISADIISALNTAVMQGLEVIGLTEDSCNDCGSNNNEGNAKRIAVCLR